MPFQAYMSYDKQYPEHQARTQIPIQLTAPSLELLRLTNTVPLSHPHSEPSKLKDHEDVGHSQTPH